MDGIGALDFESVLEEDMVKVLSCEMKPSPSGDIDIEKG